MNRVSRLFAILLLAAGALTPVLAQGSDTTTTTTDTETPTFTVTVPDVSGVDSVAFAVFAHTGADTGPVDIYIDSLSATPVVTNLAFGEATDVFAIPGGAQVISIRPNDSPADSDPLTTLSWDFTGNSTWVVAVVGLQSNLSFLAEPVTIIRTPLNGLSRVRVVNFVADAASLGVTADEDAGNSLATSLAWAGIHDADVEPGTYSLSLTGSDGAAIGDATSYTFEADTTYTLLLTGSATGTPAIDVLTVELPQDETRVRFVNERSDTVDIHVRPENGLLSGGLAAGATSEWVTLPSQASTFIAYAPGTGPTGQELAALPTQLRPGRDVTVVFTANGSVVVREETLTPVALVDDSAADATHENSDKSDDTETDTTGDGQND